MPTAIDQELTLDEIYDAAEQRCYEEYRIEDKMEAFDHAQQRRITSASFDVIEAKRKDIHYFNEMLILYPSGNRLRPNRVCPDNFVVIYSGELDVDRSFRIPLQPASPHLVMEYVSPNYQSKDYVDNFRRYENELKIPYYLLYDPSKDRLILWRLHDYRYVEQSLNSSGRFSIPELELEAALIDGWIRYWFRGELLTLPAEMLGQLKSANDQLDATKLERDAERQKRLELEMELAQLKIQLQNR